MRIFASSSTTAAVPSRAAPLGPNRDPASSAVDPSQAAVPRRPRVPVGAEQPSRVSEGGKTS